MKCLVGYPLWVPLGAVLGPLGPSWGPLGPSRGPLGPSWDPLGLYWDDLGGLSGRRGSSGGSRGEPYKNIRFPKGMEPFVPLEALLGVLLGDSWAVLGAPGGRLGAIFGVLERQFGDSGGPFGQFGSLLGPSGPFRGCLAASRGGAQKPRPPHALSGSRPRAPGPRARGYIYFENRILSYFMPSACGKA